jgi:DNA-binding XRE family transcriptional regulator
MPEAARTPPIDLRLRDHRKMAAIIIALREQFGVEAEIVEPDDDAAVNVFATEWYKQTTADMTPGNALNALRWKHQITQAELARKIGSRQQTISAIERGQRPLGLKTAVKIAGALNEPLQEFFPGGLPLK